jgi:hypothetical protein
MLSGFPAIADIGQAFLNVASCQTATLCSAAQITRAGGLLAYGPNLLSLHRLTGVLAAKVLRGANPGETGDRTADEIRNCAQHANCSRAGDIHSYVAFVAGRRDDRIGCVITARCAKRAGACRTCSSSPLSGHHSFSRFRFWPVLVRVFRLHFIR